MLAQCRSASKADAVVCGAVQGHLGAPTQLESSRQQEAPTVKGLAISV